MEKPGGAKGEGGTIAEPSLRVNGSGPTPPNCYKWGSTAAKGRLPLVAAELGAARVALVSQR